MRHNASSEIIILHAKLKHADFILNSNQIQIWIQCGAN
jgi:hypothetical protein